MVDSEQGTAEVAKASKEDRKRPISFSVRFTPRQHDALRRVAFDRRVSMQTLVLEGVAEVLQRHGR